MTSAASRFVVLLTALVAAVAAVSLRESHVVNASSSSSSSSPSSALLVVATSGREPGESDAQGASVTAAPNHKGREDRSASGGAASLSSEQQRNSTSSAEARSTRTTRAASADDSHGELVDAHLELIDNFVIVYWAVVLGCMLCIVGFYWYESKFEEEADAEILSARHTTFDIPENMWSAYFIAALDQAHYRHSGKAVSPGLVLVLCLLMGCLQMFTLFLIVHDIDPGADPVTSVPASPWKKTTWTINWMKWIMVLFLVMGLIPEVADSQEVIRGMLEVNPDRVSVPFASLWTINMFHYGVTLGCIWGGCNVILSFSAVPDIVYSSLAITFLCHVDDITYEFFKRICGVKARFQVEHRSGERKKLGAWIEMALKMMLLLPAFWGLFLISRAFYTNVMPAGRVRHVMKILAG